MHCIVGAKRFQAEAGDLKGLCGSPKFDTDASSCARHPSQSVELSTIEIVEEEEKEEEE